MVFIAELLGMTTYTANYSAKWANILTFYLPWGKWVLSVGYARYFFFLIELLH